MGPMGPIGEKGKKGSKGTGGSEGSPVSMHDIYLLLFPPAVYMYICPYLAYLSTFPD